jgi:hypothetical protein
LARTKNAAVVFSASRAGVQAKEVLGEKRYLEELLRDYLAFKESGLVKRLHLVWGEGMEDVGKGWEKLCKGEVKSDQGLVFFPGLNFEDIGEVLSVDSENFLETLIMVT